MVTTPELRIVSIALLIHFFGITGSYAKPAHSWKALLSGVADVAIIVWVSIDLSKISPGDFSFWICSILFAVAIIGVRYYGLEGKRTELSFRLFRRFLS